MMAESRAPVDFRLSDSTEDQIGRVIALYDENEGPKHWIPVIGFSEMQIGSEVQRFLNICCAERTKLLDKEITKVSGIEVVFVGSENDFREFDNKTMDFNAERGYFLRN